jgi:hypothetical protein
MFVRMGFSGTTHISVIHPGHLQGKQEMSHVSVFFALFFFFFFVSPLLVCGFFSQTDGA